MMCQTRELTQKQPFRQPECNLRIYPGVTKMPWKREGAGYWCDREVGVESCGDAKRKTWMRLELQETGPV